jgi:hypothetical protein
MHVYMHTCVYAVVKKYTKLEGEVFRAHWDVGMIPDTQKCRFPTYRKSPDSGLPSCETR